MRIKEASQYITNSKGIFVKAKQLLYSLPAGQFVNLGIRRLNKSSNYSYNLSAYRCNKTSELLVVVHSCNITNACYLYSYRWQIETMFKAFKSSGFNIENTKVVNYNKLETLFSAMAIAFAISYEIGDNFEQKNPQKLKKHGYKPIATIKLGISLITLIRDKRQKNAVK